MHFSMTAPRAAVSPSPLREVPVTILSQKASREHRLSQGQRERESALEPTVMSLPITLQLPSPLSTSIPLQHRALDPRGE